MNQHTCSRLRTALTVALALLLIVTGMVMIFRVFAQNEAVIRDNEDKQLLGFASSVDRSVVSYLTRYEADLTYVTARRGFLEAEDTWLTTGNNEDLLFRLEENLIAQDEMTQDFLVIRDETVLFSLSGRTDYKFPEQTVREGEVYTCLSYTEDGAVYLAFLRQNESGVVYAVLTDPAQFYQRVAGDVTGNIQDRIILLDVGEHTLIHRSADGIQAEPVAAMSETTCDYNGLRLMLGWEGEAGTAFYETTASISGEPYTARMGVLPADASSNRFFTIGVSINYDQFIQPIQRAAFLLMLCVTMILVGILLMFLLFLRSQRRNRQALEEIAVLEQKNKVMEELNANAQEFAHHQRLEVIGTLTSSIAHEFNNLLTPIMGYSILALEKLPEEEEEIGDSIVEIYNASRKAKTIISRLSDLSRKNTGLTYQYVSPDELAQKTLDVAKPAQPPMVEVETDFACRHVWLHGNETQLSQLLLNLVINAFHAMEETGGTLTLSTEADETHIRFRVKDTGPGIPEDVLPRIFDPFFTTKETGKGTGLGLAIVQQVVEEHTGEITVDTKAGEGTTFTISFPLHTQKDA